MSSTNRAYMRMILAMKLLPAVMLLMSLLLKEGY